MCVVIRETTSDETYQSDIVGYSLNRAPVWGSVNITTCFSFRFFFKLLPLRVVPTTSVACPSCCHTVRHESASGIEENVAGICCHQQCNQTNSSTAIFHLHNHSTVAPLLSSNSCCFLFLLWRNYWDECVVCLYCEE